MNSPALLRPAPQPPSELTLFLSTEPSVEVSRGLYGMVGANSLWTDRFCWGYEEWDQHVRNDRVSTWIALINGTIAGFFEMQAHQGNEVEICLAGLTPVFVGRGYGGYLIEQALRQAWGLGLNHEIDGSPGTQRVWLKTSTLDHPNAMKTYHRLGLEVVEVDTRLKEIFDPRHAPWPMAKVPPLFS